LHLPKNAGIRAAMLAVCFVTPAGVSASASTPGAGTDASTQDLAKKLANPVSDLVSIPFQYNWENGVGPDNDLRTILNIQPVVPFSLTPRWNLIGRWIAPYVSQPAFLGSSSGLGDIVFSTFLSPVENPALVWGVGPVLSLPMTTDPALGAGKWSAGPTGVLLKISGPWLYGVLANQLWSFASTSDVERSEVSQAFVQPFLAYCTPGGVTYTLQSESTANWQADDDADIWTIPINLQVSKVTKLGPFPFSVLGGAGVFVASPEGGPDWKLRAMFVLLLPRGS
jgi:hypothetical protein